MNRSTLAVIVAAALAIATIAALAATDSLQSPQIIVEPKVKPGHIYARPVPKEVTAEAKRIRELYEAREYERRFRRGYDACRASGLPQANSKYCANTAHLWW